MNTDNENILPSINVTRPIFSISPFTLLDYPDKTACILWFAGCNMRCSYCYNPEIVFGKGRYSFDEIIKFLLPRRNLLDGVVLSGGECTSHKHLDELLIRIKNLGFKIKIDTNGSNPNTLKYLIHQDLVDYIALDFKSTSTKYYSITKSHLYDKFLQTLDFLIKVKFPFEVRTTIHSDLLSKQDIKEMINVLEDVGYNNTYFLQNFRNDSETIEHLNNSIASYINESDLASGLNIEFRNT